MEGWRPTINWWASTVCPYWARPTPQPWRPSGRPCTRRDPFRALFHCLLPDVNLNKILVNIYFCFRATVLLGQNETRRVGNICPNLDQNLPGRFWSGPSAFFIKGVHLNKQTSFGKLFKIYSNLADKEMPTCIYKLRYSIFVVLIAMITKPFILIMLFIYFFGRYRFELKLNSTIGRQLSQNWCQQGYSYGLPSH